MENKMEEAATNLTATSSLMGEAECLTGESKQEPGGKREELDMKIDNDPTKKVPDILSAQVSEKQLESDKKEAGRKTDDGTHGKKPEDVPGRSLPEMMASEWHMEQPVCLIESNNKGDLRVNPQAVKILEAIAQPVVVVAIAGLYRTGKSYLMNTLSGQRKGFSLGSTVQSHTKGIWMWCLPHPYRAGHTLVLLDTEGLGDAHKGDSNHDAWIFTLAVLLSSTLVYNSKGTIDQDAMSKLHFVSELSEHIKVKADVTKEEEEETAADTKYVSFFPSFIWTLRDFTLELELEGRQVTEDEYLESTLMLKKGRGREVSNYNTPRECIREYFPTRKCFVFVRPANDKDMKQLELLPDSALQPEFLEQSRRFCQYVLQESRVKMLKGGHPVTGQMLGLLAQSYVETIVSGKVPCLEDAVTTIAAMQNEAAVREGLAHYVAQMEEQVTFPVEVAILSETHGTCERAALQLFMQKSFRDEDQKYQEQLAMAINEHYSAVQSRNRTTSLETCQALLSQLSADVERKLREGVYMQPGGYQLYVTDQRQVVESFQRTPNKGVMAEQVLQQFMGSKKAEAASILRADKMLSEVEKNRAADQARLEQLEQQRKAEEERRQQLEQQMRDLERSHQENISQVEAKMKEEAENLKQEMETALQCKLREQKKLLEQGFKEKAHLLQEEMEQLQKEAKEQQEMRQQEFLEKTKLMKEEMKRLQNEAKEREEKMQQEFLERDKLRKEEMKQLQKEAKEREEKMQQEFLERDKLMKEEMKQLQKEAKEREEKRQQEFLERTKLLKEEMDRRQKEGKEREDKLQQEFLERAELLKEEMDRRQKEAKEQEEKLQQEFLERDKLMKKEMKQLQKEAKEREEKLQQELLQNQMRVEEEHAARQRQHEREENERQRQWEQFRYEREAKERERQYQYEVEIQRLKLQSQKKVEEELMERQRQREQQEKENQRQQEKLQREFEAKERERQRQHELEMQKLKNQYQKQDQGSSCILS